MRRIASFSASYSRAPFQGSEATKTTLQTAAIHRDRRDRRHSPYCSTLLWAIRRMSESPQCLAALSGRLGRRPWHSALMDSPGYCSAWPRGPPL